MKNYYSGFLEYSIIIPLPLKQMLAWKTLASIHGKRYTDLSVIFQNVKLLRGTIILSEGKFKIKYPILRIFIHFIVFANSVL